MPRTKKQPPKKKDTDYGLYASLALHGAVILIAIFGLPEFLKKKTLPPMKIVTVELVPISKTTNLPTSMEAAPPKEAPKAPEPPKAPPPPPPPPPPPEPPKPEPVPEKKPEPEEKAEAHPDAPKEKKEEKKKEQKKPEPKPKVKPPEEKPKKKKEPELDFDKVIGTVEKLEKKQAKEEAKDKAAESKKSEAKAKSEQLFDPTKALSVSEQDAVRQQIAQCWSIPAGAKDAQNLQVVLSISLERDGTVRDVKITGKERYTSDSFYRAAVDSAVRAVLKCSPLKNLPPDKYESWKEMEMNFDPKEMLF